MEDETMQEIIIDEEFQRLFPMLTEQQFCSLENDILEHGCMNPLVLWNGILIDYADKIKMPMLVNVGRIVSSYV